MHARSAVALVVVLTLAGVCTNAAIGSHAARSTTPAGRPTTQAAARGHSGWVAQTSRLKSMLLGVAFANANDGWVVGSGGDIVATTNGGATWRQQRSSLLGRPAPDVIRWTHAASSVKPSRRATSSTFSQVGPSRSANSRASSPPSARRQASPASVASCQSSNSYWSSRAMARRCR